jgi:hypothetical protein
VHPTGRRGKGRSRILYWFRSPPGVRVGRGPLDEEAIRLLEAGNPELEFDWTRILKGPTAPEPAAEPQRERRERRERPRSERFARPAEPVPATVEESEPALPEPPAEEPDTAAHRRLGGEGLARLRARFSELLARIDERVDEQEARTRLKDLAERLNPDAWVTDADVQSGLETYETTFAELRQAIGPRRQAEAAAENPEQRG